MADNTGAAPAAAPYEIFTLRDGTKWKMPVGLTDEQAINRITEAYPGYAASQAYAYAAARDYDFTTGLPELGVRWNLALAGGQPEEIAGVLDKAVGAGNWGLRSGQPYVTPAGLKTLGVEDATGRNRMIDGRGAELYDLVDFAPDAAVMTAATVAGLVTAPIGGVGAGLAGGALRALLSRGLIASSTRAGLGDAAARIGIQGVQELTGGNEQSFGVIMAEAGMGGLITTAASIGLGAPLEAIARTVSAGRAAAARLPAAQRGVNPALDMDEAFRAHDFVAGYIGEPAAKLFTLSHMLKSDQFSPMLRQSMSQLEGLTIQGQKAEFGAGVSDLIAKLHAVTKKADEISITPGMAEKDIRAAIAQKKAVYDNAFTTAERKTLQDAHDNIVGWGSTPLGRLDAANASVRGFKDNTEALIEAQVAANMRRFASASHYGSVETPNRIFESARLVELSDQQAVNAINKVIGNTTEGKFALTASEASAVLAPDLVAALTKRGIAPNVDDVFFRVRDVPPMPKKTPKTAKAQEAAAAALERTPPRITVGMLMDAEQQMRQAAARLPRGTERARVLDTSRKLQEAIGTTPGVSKKFGTELSRVNAEYREFYRTFFGDRGEHNGLMDFVVNSSKNDPGALLKELTTGKNNRELTRFVEKLYKAFPDNDTGLARAAGTGTFTADEILGNLGLVYIRNRQHLLKGLTGRPADFVKRAKGVLRELDGFEQTIKSQYIGKDAEGRAVWNRMFSEGNLKNFRDTLRKIADGDDNAARVIQNNLLDFKEAERLIAGLTNAAGSLERNVLRQGADTLSKLSSVEPQFKEMYQTVFASELWSDLLKAGGITDPIARVSYVSNWARRWNESMAGGNRDLLVGLAGSRFELLNNMALVLAGKTEYVKGAGSIAANTQVMTIVRQLLSGNVQGAVKPLVYMYAMRKMGPGSDVWKQAYSYVEQVARTGQAPSANAFASTHPAVKKAVADAQRLTNAAMRGKNGFAGAAVASYLMESGLTLPAEEEAPRVPVTKRMVPDTRMLTDPAGLKREQEDAASEQQQAAQGFGVALSNLMQASTNVRQANATAKAASPFAGVGTSGLESGLRLGRGA